MPTSTEQQLNKQRPDERKLAAQKIAAITANVDAQLAEATNIADEFGIQFHFEPPYCGGGAIYTPRNWNHSDDAPGTCGSGGEWNSSSSTC